MEINPPAAVHSGYHEASTYHQPDMLLFMLRYNDVQQPAGTGTGTRRAGT